MDDTCGCFEKGFEAGMGVLTSAEGLVGFG